MEMWDHNLGCFRLEFSPAAFILEPWAVNSVGYVSPPSSPVARPVSVE